MSKKKKKPSYRSLVVPLVIVATIILLVLAVKNGVLLLSSAAPASIIWSTGHETGTISDWQKGQSGAVYNTGDATVSVTSEVKHSGTYSLKHQVRGISNSQVATRIFRWGEHLTQGYYSCWYMFPQLPRVSGWLNIFQFKKHDYADQGGTGAIDPTWYNIVTNNGSGSTLQLTHWSRNSGDIKNFAANVGAAPSLEAGKWFHIEWFYKDGVSDGQIRIWIDGTERWNMQNVETRGVHPDIQWAPSLYGDRVTPDPLTMYIDDCAISSQRLGPDWSGPGPSNNPTTPTPTPTVRPSQSPTATPRPTASPTVRPTQTPRPTATVRPTATPTIKPSTPAPSPTPVPTSTPPSTPLPGLSWEAENGLISQPFIASRGSVYQRLETGVNDGGKAEYKFTIQSPGDYVVKARVDANDDGSDSFFVNIDSNPTSAMIWDIPITRDFETRTLILRGNKNYKVYSLSAGQHTLIVRGREANTKLDRIWLEKVGAGAVANTGLTAEYFTGRSFDNLVLTRVDSEVNFDWNDKAPVSALDDNSYSIRWTGSFVAPASGTFTFYVRGDDGARLWVNNKLVVDDWRDHWAREKSGTVSLQKGQKYPIKLEYYENRGQANISLRYSYAGSAKKLIPSDLLLPN